MPEMIEVFGADGLRAGDLFPRRARQLVRQQRAVWTDERKQSVKLMPDTELDLTDINDVETVADKRPADKSLYEAARRRIRERANFVWHTIAMLPGYFVLIALLGQNSFGWEQTFFFGFLTGVWTAFYAAHLIKFVKSRRPKFFRILTDEERVLREIRRMNV